VTLNVAVLIAIPSASISIETMANPGDLASCRRDASVGEPSLLYCMSDLVTPGVASGRKKSVWLIEPRNRSYVAMRCKKSGSVAS
jgi:hypothetical protein